MSSEENDEILTPDPCDPDVAIIKSEEKYKPTAEIPFLLLFFSMALTSNVIKNLLLFRTCIHIMGYNTTICDEMQASNKSAFIEHIEEEVQPYVTVISMTATVSQGIVPAILSLFLGAWTDTHGRKPLMVWPLFGLAVSSFTTVIFALEQSFSPWWYILTVMPGSLLGGTCSLFIGGLCYITDITSEKSRSFRLAMLEGGMLVGVILGSVASPYAFNKLGYVYTLLIGTACISLAYAYTSIFIQESIPNALPGGLRSLFKVHHIKDMFRTCFKPRPNYDRAIVFLLLTTSCLSIFVMYGLLEIDYLYTRVKIMWELSEFSIYAAFNTVVIVFGLIMGSYVLQKLTGVSDMAMILVSFVSVLTNNLIVAFATKGWHFYLAGAVSFLRGTGSPVVRSQLSKIVPIEDTAKIFAFASLVQVIIPLVSPILYNTVYMLTLNKFSGTVYLMSAGINGLCLIAIGIAQYLLRRYPPVSYALVE